MKTTTAPPTARREVWTLLWRHRRLMAAALALLAVSRVAALVPAAGSKYLVDEVVGRGRASLLVPLALAMAGATLLQCAASLALARIASLASQRAIAGARLRVMRHVTRLPVEFFDRTQVGALVSRVMYDPEGLRSLVGTGVVQLAGAALTAVLALSALFWLNAPMTVGVVAVLAAFGAALRAGYRRTDPLHHQRARLHAGTAGRLTETLGGIRVVKAYGAERRERRVFARGVHALFRNTLRADTAAAALNAAAAGAVGLVAVAMTLAGGPALLRGTMTLGDLFAYVFFCGLLAGPVTQAASATTQVSEALAALARLRELLDTPPEDADRTHRRPLGRVEGHVELRGAWFEYAPGLPVLRGVDVVAPAGTTTALVGSSGSGKSTLASLVMAFAHPTAGEVRVDGRDLAGVRLADYRAQLGVVLQESFLFDGTVEENIRLSRPGATRAQVEEVARAANADAFVRALPGGYDTVVGERGVRLSGGQRQRIAIARALLADPRILILDEATSALDSESEAAIQEGLRRLRAGRTTFVIAHRLSTIRGADQILVLEGGEVVERGTHAQLMARGGRYRELHDRQHAVESDRFVNPGEEWAAAAPEPEAATAA